MQKVLLYFILFVFLANDVIASPHLYKEKDYQSYWCDSHGGIAEYVLHDKTRVDCVTERYAVEFDFAEKWAESIGQALYYAYVLNKKPAVVLIIENPQYDIRYVKRLFNVASCYGISVSFISPENIK